MSPGKAGTEWVVWGPFEIMTITALGSLSSLCLGNADHMHALGSPQATALGKMVTHAQQPPEYWQHSGSVSISGWNPDC